MPIVGVKIPHPHVVVDTAVDDGTPMIEGSRVPVHRLFAWHRQGTTVESLLRRYPQLGPAKVFDALAFAYDNQELMVMTLIAERDRVAKSQAPQAKRSD